MRIRSTSETESHTNRVRSVVMSYKLRQEVTDDVASGIRYKLELITLGEHFLTSSVSAPTMEGSCQSCHYLKCTVIDHVMRCAHMQHTANNREWAHLSCPHDPHVPVVFSNNPYNAVPVIISWGVLKVITRTTQSTRDTAMNTSNAI
jgi:hypothetical protein